MAPITVHTGLLHRFREGSLDAHNVYILIALSAIGLFSVIKALRGVVALLSSLILPGISLKKFGAKRGAWAVVTGSTAGIGLEYTKQLAAAGFNVFMIARDSTKLEETAQIIKQASSSTLTKTHAIDLAHATDAQFSSLASELKDLEVGVLINNAGVSHPYPEYFHLQPQEEWDSMISLNVVALVRLTHIILPGMISRRKGLIINAGSFSGYITSPFLTVYSGTKSFLNAFSNALGAELKDKGIVVQNLNTYFVVSKLSKIRRPSLFVPTPEAYVRAVLSHIGQSIGGSSTMPHTATPYWAHALVHAAVDRVGSWSLWFKINYAMQKGTRAKALKKREREASQGRKSQ